MFAVTRYSALILFVRVDNTLVRISHSPSNAQGTHGVARRGGAMTADITLLP